MTSITTYASQFLSQDECLRIVKRVIHTSKFELLDWNIKHLSSDGSGLIGEHFTITVSVLVHGQKDRQHLQFFAKAVPRCHEAHKEFVEDMRAFEKEIGVFCKLFVDFRNVLSEGDDQWGCKCYYTRPDIIVLEDLTTYDYRLTGKRDFLDLKHCVLVMKKIAEFHAASIIFEERQTSPCRLDHMYPDIFFETFMVDTAGHPGNDWFRTTVNGVLHIAELMSSSDKGTSFFKSLKDKIPKACEEIFKLLKPSETYRNVACHGDLWSNNIFFLYDDDIPMDVRLVDFQMLRYAPPANDVMCFLHATTNRSFRKNHLEDLQRVYYDALSKQLLNYGLNIDELLPWTQFLDSCVHLKTLGVITAALYNQGGSMCGSDLANIYNTPEGFHKFCRVDRTKELTHSYDTDPVFRSIFTEIMDEFMEECIHKSRD